MKRTRFVPLLLAGLLCLLASCSPSPDAETLLREALTKANALTGCEADYSSTLEFQSGETQRRFENASAATYAASPFAVKSTQSAGGEAVTTYTVAEGGSCWFYAETDGVWKKTESESLNTAPLEQIDLLRLLKNASSPKLVREETVDGAAAYKLEVLFPADTLRSAIETIATATGLGAGSQTLVQTLLESAPPVYGYCYIGKESGQFLKAELDAAGALNTIFGGITGDSIKVSISKSAIAGEIRSHNAVAAVELPPEAAAAQIVEAAG